MNSREKQISWARKSLSDEQLVAFFKAAQGNDVLAMELINRHVKEGSSLDDIFYTGGEYGYSLSVRKLSGSRLKISFGCQAGPLAGDGGDWKVKFDGDKILLIENDGVRMS